MNRRMITRRLLSQIDKVSFPKIKVQWVGSDDTENLNKIFELRYDVNVKSNPKTPYPANHYCINDNKFYDDYDFEVSTGHLLLSSGDKPVASCRCTSQITTR